MTASISLEFSAALQQVTVDAITFKKEVRLLYKAGTSMSDILVFQNKEIYTVDHSQY